MTAKVIDIKAILPETSSGKSAQPTTKAEALKYFRDTKPSAAKKEAVIDVVEEQIKAVDTLETDGDFKVLAKDNSEEGSGLAELLGNVNVTFSSKAKNAWMDVIATLSDDLRNSEPKTKAIIFKTEGSKIVETLFQLISIKSEDDDENLAPVQREARNLLMDAVNSSQAGSIDISSRDYMIGMISGSAKESIRSTVDLIRSESLKKLTKKDSGFIAKVGRSYGKLGKALSNFVYNKVQVLTTRPLSMTTDDEAINEVKDEISTFKNDIFQDTATEIRDDFDKKKARLKLKSDDDTFVDDFLEKAEKVFSAIEPDEANEASIELTKLITEKTSRVLNATANLEVAEATRGLLTKAINSANSKETIVDIDRSYITQDPATKDQLLQAWYQQTVDQAKEVVANGITTSVVPTRAELQKLIDNLAVSAKTTGGAVNITPHVLATGSVALTNFNLNEKQLREVLGAIDQDGNVLPGISFSTNVIGSLTDTASDYAQAIVDKLSDDRNKEIERNIQKSILIDEIDTDRSLTRDQKIDLVINGGTYTSTTAGASSVIINGQESWKMIVNATSKSTAETIRTNVDAAKKQAKEDKKYYTKFLEDMNKSIFVPIMSKASTITATMLNALQESMSDEDGNLREEFKESFADLQNSAKARIDARAKQARSDLESLELSAESSVIKSRNTMLNSLRLTSFSDFIQAATGLTGSTSKLINEFIENFKRANNDNKTGVNLSDAEAETLNAAYDSSLTPFELARKELERMQIIGSKVLQLKQAVSRKPNLITSLTNPNLVTYFNRIVQGSLASSVNESTVKAMSSNLSKLKTDYFKKIDDLKKQADTLGELATRDDIWELITDNEVEKSPIRDILRDLQNGLKDSLKTVMRSLGLMTEENTESLKKRVDAIDSDTEQTGFLAPLQTALVGLANSKSSSSKSAKADTSSPKKSESEEA
jgi:hypothetical protein